MAYIGSSPTKVVSRQSANIFTYQATANQTAFTGADANGNTLACSPSDIMVHMNGIKLEESDYSASTTTVTLGSGAAVGDEVTITAFLTFESADHYTKSAADTRYVNATGDTMTGNLGVNATLKTTHADADVVQFGGTGYLANWEDAETYLAENLYVNSSGGYRYLTNSHASLYSQTTGKHQFKVAPSGSADGTPTLTTGLEIDNSGRVTKPSQPFIELHGNNASRAMNKGTVAVFTHFGLQASAGGMTWNSSNGRITVPVAGKYIFLGKFYQWIDNATNHWIIPRKNGTAIAEYQTDLANIGGGGNTDHVVTTADIVNMAANDYIDYRMDSDIYAGYPHTNLQAFLLG